MKGIAQLSKWVDSHHVFHGDGVDLTYVDTFVLNLHVEDYEVEVAVLLVHDLVLARLGHQLAV